MTQTKRARVARQRTRQLDATLAEVNIPSRPRVGWIASIREALGMTKTQLARRIGIPRQNLNTLENNEISRSITLASLEKAANALECDLQYVFVPRQPLSKIVSDQATQRARIMMQRVNQSQALEASSIDSKTIKHEIEDLAKELEIERRSNLWND